MRVPLAPQAQESLGHSDLVLLTERGDDVARRSGPRVKMGVGAVRDRHLPRHGQPRRGSWGWPAVLWLASLLTAGDHRQVAGEASLTGMPPP
jgi:hypothetical protein